MKIGNKDDCSHFFKYILIIFLGVSSSDAGVQGHLTAESIASNAQAVVNCEGATKETSKMSWVGVGKQFW